jgi:hypothetical protein
VVNAQAGVAPQYSPRDRSRRSHQGAAWDHDEQSGGPRRTADYPGPAAR